MVRDLQRIKEKQNFTAISYYLDKRLSLGESVGHLPMECALEAVHLAHSVDPGCLMEDPGMDHLPGIVWQFQSFLLELPVTTV